MKTKDYSKVKYVKPSVDGTDITKGKVYEFGFHIYSLGYIYNDYSCRILIRIEGCNHINMKKWIPCDKYGNEI